MTVLTFLGNPCRRGHDGTRYIKNKMCVTCRKTAYKDAYEKYRQENKQLLSERSRQWYEKNKDKKRATQKIWNENNLDRRRIHSQNRVSRVGKDKLLIEDVQKIFALQRGCCAVCKTSLSSYEIDHIVPLALGGKHRKDNIQLLCRHCNRTKHSKDPVDFMQSKGFLL